MADSSGESRWAALLGEALEAVRRRRPLVHHLTNEVTAEASANAVLALGGLAMMARDAAEVEGAVDQADAVVFNLGTLTGERAAAMQRAHRAALRLGRPMVIDPVGAGSLRGRDGMARRLMRGAGWQVVRLNRAELYGVMDVPFAGARGVDAPQPGEPGPVRDWSEIAAELEDVVDVAARCAERYEVVVAATGPVDVITDGRRVVYLRSGHPWLARITGAGCMATSVVGTVLGAIHRPERLDTLLEAAVCGLAYFEAAAVWAAEGIEGSPEAGSGKEGAAGPPPGPGTFRTRLIDALYHLTPAHVLPRVEYWEVEL